jgi:FHA domain
MTGKHHAPGRFVASGGESCPRCGSAVVGQFCEACGFRVSARRPFAPLGHQAEHASAAPAEAREMSPSGPAPSGTASSRPPESLFPPVSRPEPPFSAWSRPKPPPSPPSPPPPLTAPVGQAFGVPEAPQSPDEPTVVGPFESVFTPAPKKLPPAAYPEPSYPAPEPAAAPPPPRSRPEPPTGPLVRVEPAPAASAPPTTPIPSLSRVTWTVLVASDRVYYNRMKASGAVFGSAVEFPAHTSERRIRLVGKEMRIGRRSAARDLVPEIDLADQPVDPGVSRLHAVLASASDGTWFISDPGSANGTFVNNRELDVGERVTLHEGDRINLGAWTVITVHRG